MEADPDCFMKMQMHPPFFNYGDGKFGAAISCAKQVSTADKVEQAGWVLDIGEDQLDEDPDRRQIILR